QYVHSLTHEMKSPLAAIRGSAELLENADGDAPMADADRTRFASSIRRQADRLAQMIDKLLALAAVEHRQRLEARDRIDVQVLLQEAAEQCESRLAQAGVELRWPRETHAQVVGDAFLLRQALVNLIDNAADFSPTGSAIDVQITATGTHTRIEVADRGSGVPDYALPRVFERFYSLPRPEGGSRSSGLGLCFVAEVAALHGGDARLGNRAGGGAVAVLELPAAG
ncbi:MAG TPA: ATP-binding protein, partial [Luteimonas sp.]|nr:ATP-binding protein [Luteimonas sp.]